MFIDRNCLNFNLKCVEQKRKKRKRTNENYVYASMGFFFCFFPNEQRTQNDNPSTDNIKSTSGLCTFCAMYIIHLLQMIY